MNELDRAVSTLFKMPRESSRADVLIGFEAKLSEGSKKALFKLQLITQQILKDSFPGVKLLYIGVWEEKQRRSLN